MRSDPPPRARPPRAALWTLALAALGGLGWGVWDGVLDDHFVPKRFAVVEPGLLYRSGQISPRLIRGVLEEHDIRVVISMLNYDEREESHRVQRAAMEDLGIEYANLTLNGNGTGELRHYAEALEMIALAHVQAKAVLVHCAAGSRRAAGVVAAYQVLVQDRRPEDVWHELDRYGSRPVEESPLLDYLNDNMGELAGLLVERGVLDRVPHPLPRFTPASS